MMSATATSTQEAPAASKEQQAAAPAPASEGSTPITLPNPKDDYGIPIPTTMIFYEPKSVDPPGGKPFMCHREMKMNFKMAPKDVVVNDMRKLKDDKGEEYVNLANCGFETHKHPELDQFEDPHFDDGQWVKDVYWPVVQKILCKRFQAEPSSVILVNAVARINSESDFIYNLDSRECKWKGPAMRFFGPGVKKLSKSKLDENTGKGYGEVGHTDGHDVFYDDCMEAHVPGGKKGVTEDGIRFRHIGVWQPVGKTVWDAPLAMADVNTMKREDYAGIEVRFGGWKDETFEREQFETISYGVDINHTADWYSVSHQTPEELVLIKHYDTSDPFIPRGTPHSAFRDRRYWDKPGVPGRESIELRVHIVGGV